METRETICMDAKTQHRSFVLGHLRDGRITVAEAAAILRLSARQVQRLLAALRAEGVAGLVHGNRGRAPAHRTPEFLRTHLVELATTTYAGVNRAHLADLLMEREGLLVPARTLRRVLAEAGLPPVRKRRPRQHRARRERVAQAGQLLQLDGSRHHWLGPDRPFLTLIGAIDDATGVVTAATFRAQEDAAGYFSVLTRTVIDFGRPAAVYSDRHGIFVRGPQHRPSLAEQLAGREPTTQVGRALATAGIGWIGARSPQAKGRVERLWGTLQDRLVSELRLAGASTLEEANAVLAAYLPRHNERFAVPAADPVDAWRPWSLPDPVEAVFCFHYSRRVANDATVSWTGQPLAVPRRQSGGSWAGRAVTVEERLDGSLWVAHRDGRFQLAAAPPDAPTLRARKLHDGSRGKPDYPVDRPGRPSRGYPAKPDHPWRR
jgi:transposase